MYEKLQKAIRIYYPALLLESVITRRTRRILKKVFGPTAVFAVGVIVLMRMISLIPKALNVSLAALPFFGEISVRLWGLFLSALSFWLILTMLDALYYSYVNLKVKTLLPEWNMPAVGAAVSQFELAQIICSIQGHDIIKGFLQSEYGRQIMLRCGIAPEDLDKFLAARQAALNSQTLSIKTKPLTTLSDLAKQSIRYDKDLEKFLLSREVTAQDFIETAKWVERMVEKVRKQERWWSRDNLARVRGIGKEWAYGETYLLEKYGHGIAEEPIFTTLDTESFYGRDEVEALEAVLARSYEANALLVGEEGVGKIDIIARLAKKIEDGNVLAPLGHKQVVVLDHETLVAGTGNKGAFERELLSLLNQSVTAGNIILVLDDFPSFIKSAAALGSDIIPLLDSYLASPRFQVIATSDTGQFHKYIESNPAFMRRFEVVIVKKLDMAVVIRLLEDKAMELERKKNILITYMALKAVAESANEYFPYGAMPDKAFDLLIEVVPKTLQAGERVIHKDHVLKVVTAKTGIPTGGITPEEKEKLSNLETLLHKRVVDQDEAIIAVSNALRRARSGVGNASSKPMGSFLFLGPTGVGKTETAKALAEAFFGRESSMLRLDMSEYSTPDALPRLIGSQNHAGILSSLLREQPYGVLLIDEFEKTNKEVLNLFLQILDEGFFSDAAGKRVSARHVIIIATSNAGSDFIWNLSKQGTNPAEHKGELIDVLVKRGIFAPELLNRFDSVVVFHPLGRAELRQIARLMLKNLADRLKKQGIVLNATEEMVSVLVKYGYDPKFGARPMRRALQEKIEQAIARKIISGEIKAGTTISSVGEEISTEESS
jgi:ATP-dependent Clp protease ATP-binding subunit ClpC